MVLTLQPLTTPLSTERDHGNGKSRSPPARHGAAATGSGRRLKLGRKIVNAVHGGSRKMDLWPTRRAGEWLGRMT